MSGLNRREFLRSGSIGLAAGVGVLTLRAGAQPTPETPDVHDYRRYLDEEGTPRVEPAGEFAPTAYNTPGPFYRPGAPYRAKVSPPLAAGSVLVITGRVWSHETRRPLAAAHLDIWQADTHGRYDNDDRDNPPAPRSFSHRARLLTDETGYYEYETIRPAPYDVGNSVRPSHIHYLIRAAGHKELTTQLYFKGDPHLADDPIALPSLVIEVDKAEGERGEYERGVFDIVLERE